MTTQNPRITFNAGRENILELDGLEFGDYDGNLYIFIDGKEYGSLHFSEGEDGKPKVTLGQYDDASEEWQSRNPLTHPVPPAIDGVGVIR